MIVSVSGSVSYVVHSDISIHIFIIHRDVHPYHNYKGSQPLSQKGATPKIGIEDFKVRYVPSILAFLHPIYTRCRRLWVVTDSSKGKEVFFCEEVEP